jgi:hypothetical protein
LLDYKLITIHILNFADAVLTLIAILHFGVEEANPLMREALNIGPLTFLLAKFSLVGFAVEYLAATDFPNKNLVVTALLVGFLTLTAWHLFGVYVLIF